MLKSKFFQHLRRKGRIDSTFNAGDGAKLIENYCSKCGNVYVDNRKHWYNI